MAIYELIPNRGVPLINPETGRPEFHSEEFAVDLINSKGWKPITGEEYNEAARQARNERVYDRPVEAGLRGAARGATFGLSDILGGKDWTQESRMLAEYNPTATTLGEVGGAVATSFIPGSPVALLGKAGAAVGKGVGAALGGGKLATAAGLLARGGVEGAAYGAGGGISQEALSADPTTIESLVSNIGKGMAHGAAWGAPLSLGIASVGAAGKWGLERVGIGPKARALLEKEAVLQGEIDLHAAARAQRLGELNGTAERPGGLILGQDARNTLEVGIKDLEGQVQAATKNAAALRKAGGLSAAEELPSFADSQKIVSTLEKHQDAIDALALRGSSLKVQLAEAKVVLGKLKPTAGAKASKAEPAQPDVPPDVLAAQKEIDAIRKAKPDIPPFEDRVNAMVERAGQKFPEVAAAAGRHDTPFGKMWSLYKHEGMFRPEGMTEAALSSARKSRYLTLGDMERFGGVGNYGAEGEALARAEVKVASWLKNNPGLAETFPGQVVQPSPRQAGQALQADAYQQAAAHLEEVQQKIREASMERALLADKAKVLEMSGAKAADLPKWKAHIEALKAESGVGPQLDERLRQLAEDNARRAEAAGLKNPVGKELELEKQLQAVAQEMASGKAGLAGKIAGKTIQRAAIWGGTRKIAELGGAGGAGRRGGLKDWMMTALGMEVSKAIVPKLLGGLKGMVSPAAISAGGAVESIMGVARPVGRAMRQPVMGTVQYLTRDEMKGVMDDLKVSPALYEATARVALSGHPPDVVASTIKAHGVQRDFLTSKMPVDPRQIQAGDGTTIPLKGKWEPSPIESARFGRYVRGAMHWKNTIEDLVDRTVTPEAVEAMKTCYPEVYEPLCNYIRNGIRETSIRGGAYSLQDARQLDLVLGPPYRMNEGVSTFQRSFAPQERTMPPRSPGGKALTTSTQTMNVLERAQTGK